MASSIFIMEQANLFCGDHDPENSKHLTLENVKLPDLQEVMVDHMPGGGRVGIELAVGIQKLEATFKLKGQDPDLLSQFGAGSPQRRRYTAYGVIRNKRTGAALESKAIIEARLGRIAQDAFTKGEVQGTEYSLNEIFHYQLFFAGDEKFYWDLWTNALRIDGQDPDPDVNRILRLSAS